MTRSAISSLVLLTLCGCLAAHDDPAGPSASPDLAIGEATAATASSSVVEDAYVSSSFPDDPHGALTQLVIGTASGNLHHDYLKLAISGIPAGASQIQATLRVTPQSGASNTIQAHCGASSSWSEATLTWNNQPGFAAAVVSSVTSETAGSAAAFDISPCVTGDGTFTVVLDQPSGGVIKLASRESTAGAPSVAVTFTAPSCTGPDALLVPCPGKRWEAANPTLNAVDVADLQAFETMQGAQLGAVHFFRTPGSTLWGTAGGFQEQVYLNSIAAAADPRHVYIGYRPNADWSLFDGLGSDDAATISRIHADARRTITLFNQVHRKIWINAVNHEAERYVFGCGGNNATQPNNTVAAYQAAWRNVVAIFDAELATAGLPAQHGAAGYPVVWAINTQNLAKATAPATCKDASGNGLSSFRAVMLALVPRTAAGAPLVQWFGWNPYTRAGGAPLPTVIDDGYNWLVANAPADVRALPWHFGEFGYLGDGGPPSASQCTQDFTTLAGRLDAGSWPNVRLMMYFDDVPGQDPATLGCSAAFRTYATSSTMIR
jgi:hypothetical protein